MLGILAGMCLRDSYAARLPHAVVHVPVVCNDSCREFQSAENCGFSAVAGLGKVVNILVLVQTSIPMVQLVQQTIGISQLQFDKIIDVPVCASCRFSGAG